MAGEFNVWIEHSGKKIPYPLARDENGQLAYRSGLAQELSPQVMQSNYSYGHIPPQVSVIHAYEDWRQGGGFSEAEDGPDHSEHSAGRSRYNYAQGVDASWGGLRLGFKLQTLLESDSTAIAAAPDFYSRTSDGLFMVAGRYVYEFTTSNWTQRADLGSGNVGTGPVVDFNGKQFVPCGDSDDYFYSSDGVTWAAVTTITDKSAQFFLVRGQSSGSAVLWKISSTGALKNNTSGESSGGQWSAATQIGGTGETVGGMVVMGGDIVVFKTDGIYTFDGTTADKVWDGGRLMYHSTNGSNPTIWSDGKCYTAYGNCLIAYDNVDTAVEQVWPVEENKGNSELNGQITAICASVSDIFFALKNAAGNTYIMKGKPGVGFHPVHYLGANDCDALLFAGPGDLSSTNPCLVIGYGTAGDYYIYPRSGMLPEDDSNVEFLLTGFIVGGLDSVNAKGFKKFLNGGSVLGKSLATGKTVELQYEIDEDGEYHRILLAESSGYSESATSNTVEFNQVRYKAILTAPTSADTPIAKAVVLSSSLNNPRKRLWQFNTEIKDSVVPSGGGTPRASAIQMESHLFDAKNERCYFYDINGAKWRVRLIDPQGTSAAVDPTGGVRQNFTVTLVEV